MRISSVKLFFNIALIFTVAAADSNLENSINCSLISDPSSIIEIMPIKYNVELTINPEIGNIIIIADIIIYVKQPMKNIKLHVREMKTNISASKIVTIDPLSDCSHGYAPNKMKNFDYCKENDILILTFEKKIHSGYYCMHLELASSLFYDEVIFPYFLSADHNKWLITNLYKPNAIHRLLPCWDDPAIKASFNISIRHPINYTVLSSAPIWYKSIEGDGMEWTYFREISSISTYQLAIAMDITHLTILHLAEYTNMSISDVIEKIDHIIVPNGPIKSAGGRQLVIYREKDVIYEETSDTFGQNIDVTKLVAYEMARQWLIGYASPHLKNDIGINEILASFYSYYITTKLLTVEKLMQLFVVQNLQTALDSDVSLELESIICKTKGDSGIDGLLYSLLYHKKAFALIYMLNYLVTPKVLQQAIEKYIHTRTEDLWVLLEEQYTQKDNRRHTIKEIMYSWLTTAHYPTLRIIKHEEHQRNHTKQDRRRTVHYTLEMTKEQNNGSKWKIPINYITRLNLTSYNITNFIWFESSEVGIIEDIDPTDFYILNVDQIGFYRVNYDHKNWLMIASYLQFDTYSNIPAINRAQLINDAYYYTIKGELNSFIFIELIRYLRYETNYIPWYPMFNILVDMSTYLQTSRGRATKQQFLYLFHGLLQSIGYEERLGDNEMTKSLRLLAIMWACKLGHGNCRRVAADRLTIYINSQTRTIPSVWKNWILCTGMMQITSTNWNNILQESIEYKRPEFLEYLTCSEDANIIVYYLSLMLHADLEEHVGLPMVKIYLSVVKKHLRKLTVLKYVLNNYNEAVNRFPADFENNTLMAHIFMSVDSMEALEQIHTFARYNFRVDEHQLWHMFHNMKALRSWQIMKEQSRFEMF